MERLQALQEEIARLKHQHERTIHQCEALALQNRQYQAQITAGSSLSLFTSPSNARSRATSAPAYPSTEQVSATMVGQQAAMLQSLGQDAEQTGEDIQRLRARLRSPSDAPQSVPAILATEGARADSMVEHLEHQLTNLRSRLAEVEGMNESLQLAFSDAQAAREQDAERIGSLEYQLTEQEAATATAAATASVAAAAATAHDPAAPDIRQLEQSLADSLAKLQALELEYAEAQRSAQTRYASLEEDFSLRIDVIQTERDHILEEITQLSNEFVLKAERVEVLEGEVGELRRQRDADVRERDETAATITRQRERLATLEEQIRTSGGMQPGELQFADRILELESELAAVSALTAAQMDWLQEDGSAKASQLEQVRQELAELRAASAAQQATDATELDTLRQHLNAVTQERDTILVDIQTLSLDFLAKDQEVETLNERLQALEGLHAAQKAEMEAALLTSAERITQLEKELEAANAQLDLRSAENATLIERTHQLTIDVQEWSARVPGPLVGEAEAAKLAALHSRNVELEGELHVLRGQADDFASRIQGRCGHV